MRNTLPALFCAILCASPLRAGTELALPPMPPADAPASDSFKGFGESARRFLDGLLKDLEPGLDEMGKTLGELQPMMRDLAERLGDVRNYEAPETLPNGDILIRRKPGSPPLPETAPKAAPPQIDL